MTSNIYIRPSSQYSWRFSKEGNAKKYIIIFDQLILINRANIGKRAILCQNIGIIEHFHRKYNNQLTAATGCQGSFEDLWQTFRVNQCSPVLVDEDISKLSWFSSWYTVVQPSSRLVFQQDSSRCHISRVAMKFLNDNHIRTLPWPELSPDLNPIDRPIVWCYW
jgi:hypothetical protein